MRNWSWHQQLRLYIDGTFSYQRDMLIGTVGIANVTTDDLMGIWNYDNQTKSIELYVIYNERELELNVDDAQVFQIDLESCIKAERISLSKV